jgi:hypothetical protein
MATLLIPPNLQFIDQNGSPYAGGKLYTYVPNTFTPKATWQNETETIANTNPVILNDSGFAVVFGDGDYRLVLTDANNVQVFDQLSESPLPSSAISAAMLPVVGALTTAQAVHLLGIDSLINDAISNINLEQGPVGPTGPTGPQGIQGPTGPAGDAAFTFGLSNPGYVLLGTYGSAPLINWGFASSDSGGHASATFAKSYTSGNVFVNCTCVAPEGVWANPTSTSNTGFTAVTMSPYAPGSTYIGPIGFAWMAIGW